MTVKRLEIRSKDGAIPNYIWEELLRLDKSPVMLRGGWSWEIPQETILITNSNGITLRLPESRVEESVILTFSDKIFGVGEPVDPEKGFKGKLGPLSGNEVEVVITERDINDCHVISDEAEYDKLYIGDLVDSFILDDSQRDERDPDEMIVFHEGRGCGSLQRSVIDDYSPKESIMMFDMSELTTLEQDILISMFEGRKYDS